MLQVNFKLRTANAKFKVLFLDLIAASAFIFLFFPVAPVQASGCISGSLAGTCKDACGGDELDGNALILAFPDGFKPEGVCQKTCCVAKGQTTCSAVSALAGAGASQAEAKAKYDQCVKTGQDSNISGGALVALCGSGPAAGGGSAAYTCSKPCTGTSLVSKAGTIGETCQGDQVCCEKASGAAASAPAQPSGKAGSTIKLQDPLGGATFFTLINRVITAFLGMVGALALGVFVYAGVLWMTAGSSDRVKEAKDAMKYAVIGLAMIAFSFAITSFFLGAFTQVAPPVEKPPAVGAPELK